MPTLEDIDNLEHDNFVDRIEARLEDMAQLLNRLVHQDAGDLVLANRDQDLTQLAQLGSAASLEAQGFWSDLG